MELKVTKLKKITATNLFDKLDNIKNNRLHKRQVFR